MPFGATALGIGSLIGGGLGLWGAASANSANKQQWSQTKEGMGLQDKYNKENADIAWERQKEMYERTYKDESYKSKVEQMKEAGLNVGLMYSGGATAGGGQGTIGGIPQAAGAAMGQAPNAQGKIQSQMMGAQLAMQSAQAAADIKLKESQAENLDASTEKTKGVDTEKVTAEIESLKATTGYTELRAGMQKMENLAKGETINEDITKAKAESRRATYEAMEAAEDYTQAQIKAEVDGKTKEANIRTAWNQVALGTAEVVLKGAQIKYTDAQVKGLAEQIKQGWVNVGLREGELKATIQRILQDKQIWGEQMSENAKDRAVDLLTAPMMNGVMIRNSSVDMEELLTPGGDVSGIKQW